MTQSGSYNALPQCLQLLGDHFSMEPIQQPQSHEQEEQCVDL